MRDREINLKSFESKPANITGEAYNQCGNIQANTKRLMRWDGTEWYLRRETKNDSLLTFEKVF